MSHTARFNVGDSLPEKTYVITQEKIRRYSRYALSGKDARNIHTDADKAKLAGLPGPVAHGRLAVAFFSEAMLRAFGEPWLTSGHLDVTLTRLIFPGDTLRLRATVAGVTRVAGGERVDFDMTLVNQKGETVQSAQASAILPTQEVPAP